MDNSPINYTINFSLSKSNGFERPYEKKRHILICDMATEDLEYYREVEKAAWQYVMARESGGSQNEYRNLMKILGMI